ncbi:hypothetical protein BDW59DRAFT_142081 [Aspergillus cavernicola]|uniref:Uncharacterized protein n=1 Tax=Aspergillus cavernicola TaxID=176166 RepID=A0ABR4IP56_9EURO
MSGIGIRIPVLDLIVPRDYNRASTSSAIFTGDRWNATFQTAPTTPMYPKCCPIKQHKQSMGYPIHADCWAFVDRVMNHQLVIDNLRLFIQAVLTYRRNPATSCWRHALCHLRDSDCHYYWCQHSAPRCTLQYRQEQHPPWSPLCIPELTALVSRVTDQPTRFKHKNNGSWVQHHHHPHPHLS